MFPILRLVRMQTSTGGKRKSRPDGTALISVATHARKYMVTRIANDVKEEMVNV